jgi:hypothetical protein
VYVVCLFRSVLRMSSFPLASCLSDPLIGHGRHFCRTVHALCNVQALLTNGILRLGEQADEPDEVYTTEYIRIRHLILSPDSPFCIARQRREHRVFSVLLQMVPNLEARLMEGDDDDVVAIADLVRRIWLGHTSLLNAF